VKERNELSRWLGSPLVFELHGCKIAHDDAVNLYDALRAEGSAAARETAEAIRWGSRYGLSAELDPDMRGVILKVIDTFSPTGFS